MDNSIKQSGKTRLLIARNFEMLVEIGFVKRDQIRELKKFGGENSFDTLYTEVLTELPFMPIVEKVAQGEYQLLQHPDSFKQILSDFRQMKVHCYIIGENTPEELMRKIRPYIFYINGGLSPVSPLKAIEQTYDNKELFQFVAKHLLGKINVTVADWKQIYPLNCPSAATINRIRKNKGLVKQRSKKTIDTIPSNSATKLSFQAKQLTMV